MHRAIASKLRQGPEPVEIARRNLDRWASTAGRSSPYLQQWRAILELPRDQIAALIEEDSERMTALLQSNPFAEVLTPRERWKIYDAFAIGTYNQSIGDHRR